jgi:hypothetical protein
MIGATQWAISLGRFDIQTAIMTVSQFRIAPQIGHLHGMKSIYGYLKRYKHGAIRVRTEKPEISNFHMVDYNWLYTVYRKMTELIPNNIPEPLGKSAVCSHYTDANLYHDMINGRSVTGIMHFANSTPIDTYLKRQSTVETATYGAEFVAARIATDRIVDLSNTLRYLGVPIEGKSHLFGDSASDITSATISHPSLKKRHNALSFHQVREALAAGIMYFHKIAGKLNPSNILCKHTGYPQAWPILKPLLVWKGRATWFGQIDDTTNGECQDIGRDETNEEKHLYKI